MSTHSNNWKSCLWWKWWKRLPLSQGIGQGKNAEQKKCFFSLTFTKNLFSIKFWTYPWIDCSADNYLDHNQPGLWLLSEGLLFLHLGRNSRIFHQHCSGESHNHSLRIPGCLCCQIDQLDRVYLLSQKWRIFTKIILTLTIKKTVFPKTSHSNDLLWLDCLLAQNGNRSNWHKEDEMLDRHWTNPSKKTMVYSQETTPRNKILSK